MNIMSLKYKNGEHVLKYILQDLFVSWKIHKKIIEIKALYSFD